MFKKLITLYNRADLQIVIGLLEANDITFYKSSDFDGFMPLETVAANIYVDESQFEEAMEVISRNVQGNGDKDEPGGE